MRKTGLVQLLAQFIMLSASVIASRPIIVAPVACGVRHRPRNERQALRELSRTAQRAARPVNGLTDESPDRPGRQYPHVDLSYGGE